MIVTQIHAVDLGQSIWVTVAASENGRPLTFDAVYSVEPDASKVEAIDRSKAAFIVDHAERLARAFDVDVGEVQQAFAAFEGKYGS